MPSLGQELKQLREDKGISLRQISDATHIGMRFLQAIESDSFDALPGGIFNRSFVRKYAKYIGIDEEQVLARYDHQVAEQPIEQPKPSPLRYQDFENRSTSAGSLKVVIPLLLLLGAGLYFTYRYINTHAAGQTETPSEATVAPSPMTAASATPGATGEGTAGEASPSPTAPSAGDGTATPVADASGTPGTRPAGDVSELRLRVTATNNSCWINVKTDDTKEVKKTLQLGETQEFLASDKIELHLGNVTAVSATLNGRPMKLTPTRSKTVIEDVITKDNYQKFVQ
jgi:cytoskeleton protein RodZ